MISKSGFADFKSIGSIQLIELADGGLLLVKEHCEIIVEQKIQVAQFHFNSKDWILASEFLSWLLTRSKQQPGKIQSLFLFLSDAGGETYFRKCLDMNPLNYEDFREIFYRYLGEYESEDDRKTHDSQERRKTYGW